MVDRSNSEVAFNNADKILSDLGATAGKGLMAKLDFIAKAAELYVAKELRHVAPKGKGKVTHSHFAAHAVEKWNEKQTAQLGKADVMVEGTVSKLTSEVGAVFRATAKRPDIVPFARGIDSDMRKADKEYSIKTYDAVIKVARAQANDMDNMLTEEGARAALTPTASETDETKSLDAIVKKLNKMADEFPANAAAYKAAATALAPIVSLLKGDAERQKFIDAAVLNGHDAKAAAAFYDAPRKKAA
jgi:ribosomal protein L35